MPFQAPAPGSFHMTLTELQTDAISELVNIAFARAGAALGVLSGNRVELTTPDVVACPVAGLGPALRRFVGGEVATVHQVFSGPVAGDALLVLDVAGAGKLIGLLTGEHKVRSPDGGLARPAREALAEVGNILLSACLGVFGDLLRVRFTFAVPLLHLDSLEAMLESLRADDAPLRHALLVGAQFQARASEVTGCIVLVLGVTCLETFLRSVEEWGDRSVSEV